MFLISDPVAFGHLQLAIFANTLKAIRCTDEVVFHPLVGVRSSLSLSEKQFFRCSLSKKSQQTAATMMNSMQSQSTESLRYAVVTGANKGIGFETVRQLAAAGVTVVLTARNEKRGMEAMSLLHGLGFPNVLFHQLNVQDLQSIEGLANFIQTRFGKLDILVNNAGASGVVVDEEGLRALNIDPASWLSGKATNMVQGVIKTTYEKAKECLDTNYYGVKNLTQALLPLLQRSTSGGRIVNVSSLRGELWRIPNEEIRKELADVENLSEEKIDGFVEKFLDDLRNDELEVKGWSKMLPAYSVSKTYPNMCINCVHPGYVDTDLNWHTGTMTLEEGAQGSVMLALLPQGGPTGCYFDRTQVAQF
ncbi:unnamed protein product [Lactuca virosa]|uniref:(+)-neomenthol dehydrogenase n=1 Tax=Lactuca virosa TaxID=75947 RepID=A0AAU9MZ00_9ASTR|nr:unnamed protein product [Lactuca virosa]